MADGGDRAGHRLAEELTATSSSARRDARNNDDATSILVLRAASAVAVAFLVLYLGYDLWSRREDIFSAGVFHWISILVAIAFLAASFISGFRAYWKSSYQLFALVLVSAFMVITADTRDSDAKYIAMIFAAIAFAECTVSFLSDYRQRIESKIEQLKQASALRESQIAALAHDIRNPVGAIAGFVELLEDPDLEDEDRRTILERIGTTAWLADLTVSNLLDLDQIRGGRLSPSPSQVDANRIVRAAASNCAPQALHKGLKLTVSYGDVAPGNFDSRHLERIARNMLAFCITRSSAGEIRLRTSPSNTGIAIEVEDDGPLPSDEEMATFFRSSAANGVNPAKTMVGLFVARALAETSGGSVELTLPNAERVRLTAEVPSATIASKPRAT